MQKNKVNFQLYKYEQKYWSRNLSVCGIDEVGRGCLAGPVVTSAVILHHNQLHPKLADSKTMTTKTMLEVYNWLIQNCTYSIGINSARIIDQKNIYQATKITMKQAILHLFSQQQILPSLILIDAMPLNLNNSCYQNIECKSLIKGESKSASIAAASVIAKVTRDNIVHRINQSFPLYNLKQHKGYATKYHRQVIIKQHASIIHRQTFLKNLFAKKDHCEQRSIFD